MCNEISWPCLSLRWAHVVFLHWLLLLSEMSSSVSLLIHILLLQQLAEVWPPPLKSSWPVPKPSSKFIPRKFQASITQSALMFHQTDLTSFQKTVKFRKSRHLVRYVLLYISSHWGRCLKIALHIWRAGWGVMVMRAEKTAMYSSLRAGASTGWTARYGHFT